MRGYRGLFRELGRTGSLRSLVLQLRTGIVHVLRRGSGRAGIDPVERFYAHYGPDGVHPPEPRAAQLSLDAQRCLACGLCSIACAEVGGAPPLDPRDAVLSASRLGADWRRLGIAPTSGDACHGCDACERSCPAGIPIPRVQRGLTAAAGPPAGRGPTALRDATEAGIG